MRFINDGPDIPDRLIQAHEDGNVVFFCGAGVSYPAGLPLFGQLVKLIYERIGETMTPEETQAFAAGWPHYRSERTFKKNGGSTSRSA
ncbi:MAG: hypothetical protein JWN43_2613 [Gammaproteobacteria bacterium]|nr:hypothetical protein [Gammaproteobacteria bacterium]